MAEALQANIEEQSQGLFTTAKCLTLMHWKARSGLPISVN